MGDLSCRFDKDSHKKASDFCLGTLGRAIKNNIIAIEDFDINQTPNKITIEKFTDADGQEMVNMWYEL